MYLVYNNVGYLKIERNKSISYKIKKLKQRKEKAANKKCKRLNLDKQRLKVRSAYKKLTNKRQDYINKTVNEAESKASGMSNRPE